MSSWTTTVWVCENKNWTRVLPTDTQTRDTNWEMISSNDLHCTWNTEWNKKHEERCHVMLWKRCWSVTRKWMILTIAHNSNSYRGCYFRKIGETSHKLHTQQPQHSDHKTVIASLPKNCLAGEGNTYHFLFPEPIQSSPFLHTYQNRRPKRAKQPMGCHSMYSSFREARKV